MSTYAASMPSVMFGSPKDWDDWFWDTYEAFREILVRACPPDGQEQWVKRECAHRGLR